MLNTLTAGLSFAMLTLISFDRARALTNPLRYRTEVRNKGMLVTRWQIEETGLTGFSNRNGFGAYGRYLVSMRTDELGLKVNLTQEN